MSDAQGKTTYTLSEAARLLSCHKETLRRAIHGGHLRAAKLGRGFRISRVDLEAFWTSSGGGSLFEISSDASASAQRNEPEHRGKKAAPKGPHQLSLLSETGDA